MKRVFVLLALALISLGRAVADEVKPSEAVRVAREVLSADDTRGVDITISWDSSSLLSTRSGDEAPSFYVVAPASGKGFVVVAGDDVLTPILAYSTTSEAPRLDSMHPALEGWFGYVDDVVRYARSSGLEADASTLALWAEPATATESIMLNTARWNQYDPYCRQCPADEGYYSITGCTQTAMAEIMYYYRWPESAQGTTEPFTTPTKGIYVPSRDLNHSYDWDNMLDEYVEGGFTEEQAAAVAMLMSDLGHSFQADYTYSSTASLPNALAMYQNYGYDPTAHYAMRDNYTTELWIELMRGEIEAQRPILYSGYTEDLAGHAFVLDGVDADNYFHVNWGWGGVGNGFFSLDALDCQGLSFNTMQWAFLGLHPMRDNEIEGWLYLYSPGFELSNTEFAMGKEFVIERLALANTAVLNFTGDVRVGVCDIDGKFKSWATDKVYFTLEAGYVNYLSRLKASITEPIAAGDRLRLFYRSKGSEEWFEIKPFAGDVCWEVILKKPTIGDTTSLEFDKLSNEIVVCFDRDVSATLLVDDSVQQTGVTHSEGKMQISCSDLERGRAYTILLERGDGEQKRVSLTLNELAQ